jgi:L-aspartate oxidase
VLTGAGFDPFLITEAIRGEGAYLVSANGTRFMLDLHELAELAPRDIVARAIQRQVTIDGGLPVSLDLRHLDPEMVLRRFPTIAERLKHYGLTLTTDLIPVAPAAHYFMGGIVADAQGRTSMEGLVAIGEVSCTGVHGANRLASNSLLEGLVFGLGAAELIASHPHRKTNDMPHSNPPAPGSNPTSLRVLRAARGDIQRLMSAHIAVVRNEAGMRATINELIAMGELVTSMDAISAIEIRNLLLLALEAGQSALARKESRGAHFRDDFPDREVALDHHHQVVQATGGDIHRQFGSLRQLAADR